ncbi:hypothetical protein [Bacteroides sp. 519]|uniref:hypothetical protein n=1 Tax=Bacteroides sp. 519 TaxID=2302937 RepID=UPI0013D4593E|nr:hypothetical protein [Bacteroides sp. 519]NDV59336.1 hypothetical protein [Bacteroides sp. 519]
MKETLNTIVLFTLLLAITGCEEIPESPSPAGTCTLSFNIDIPTEEVINTREVIQTGTITNLYVLVFDPDGHFLTRAQAIPTATPGKYTVQLSPTDTELPQDERKRIIHFVCNYDWSAFSDVRNIGKHENEVITGLSVTNGKTAYWQRVELVDGIVQNAFPNTIGLLCNMAKISVINNSKSSSSYPELTNAQFALGDYYDYGTVAPFHTTSFAFVEGAVCESPKGSLQTILESDFVETGQPIHCYERHNVTSNTPLYIILKGKYDTDTEYSYYKIDIIDEGEEELYNITRNYHYIIEVTEIAGPGLKTLHEAINSPASNNLLYSVLLQDYTAISDGYAALKVETTMKTIVQPNQEFTISFSYVPNIATDTENNTMVHIELEQDDNAPVVNLLSQVITTTPGQAHYKATTVGTVPQYEIYTARLVFTATQNGRKLRRTVLLRFRQPSVFEDVHVTPTAIPAVNNKEVELRFTIPTNINSKLFPMEMFVTTLSLTPNLDYTNQDKLSFDYNKPGAFRYKYIVRNAGEHVVHFRTTGSTTNEVLELESELFTTARVTLAN